MGSIELGEIKIIIRPKITGAPFLRLLRYAYGFRDLKLFESTTFSNATGSFQDLIIYQFVSEVSELLLCGLHRDYKITQEDLSCDEWFGIAEI